MNHSVPQTFPVIVIGAGAAGLLAATAAAERGKRVMLLEKNTKPGVKILMSGGTRCNITQATDRRGIVQAFGDQGPFLHSSLAALGPDELVDLIEAEGVRTKTEETGKIFPQSNRAIDVRDALLRRLHRSGAHLALDEAVLDIDAVADGFRVTTTRNRYVCNALVITTGGQSYPGCGTTGDGYAWAKRLGHRIVPPSPALVPLTTNAEWIPLLRGVTLPDVALRLSSDRADKPIEVDLRRGSLLFTHFGLSGPVAMDISRSITTSLHRDRLTLTCDFLPDSSGDHLVKSWQDASKADGKKPLVQSLSAKLPRRFAEQLLQLAQVPSDRRLAELTRHERQRMTKVLKSKPIPIAGTLGFKKAEVTAGGVDLAEVDSRSLQSKLRPGLFFAGEILDLDGPIGGFNFQAAFSTGWLAGLSVP